MNHLLIGLIVVLGFLAQSIFGFGGGLITVPLVSLVLGVKDTVTLILLFQFCTGLLIFKTRHTTAWKVALPITIGMLVGIPVGVYSLTVLSETLLRRFLAVFILLFLVRMQFFPNLSFGPNRTLEGRFQQEFIFATLIGVAFGWVQGMLGSGGPIVVMYLLAVLPEKAAFRSTLIYLGFASQVVRVVASLSVGLITAPLLNLALPILPFFLIAIFAGQYLQHKIPENYYQIAVRLILFGSAISLLLK